MTQEEFVRNLKIAVLDTTVYDTLSILLDPPGRRPDRSNDPTADWYRELSVEGQAHVQKLAQLVANSVLFGVFAVLDGVRAIEDGSPKCELKLTFEKDGNIVWLNDPNGAELHNVFNGLEH